MTTSNVKDSSPNGPSLNVLAQFVKDFSFENPNAPGILSKPPQSQPQINVQVNVGARQLGAEDYEVDLHLEARAGTGADMLFATEIVYSGIFRLQGLDEETLQAVVMIECPRLLFPFARAIIADATRNGGYPPLLLDPIDFVALYQSRNTGQPASPAAPKPAPAASDEWGHPTGRTN